MSLGTLEILVRILKEHRMTLLAKAAELVACTAPPTGKAFGKSVNPLTSSFCLQLSDDNETTLTVSDDTSNEIASLFHRPIFDFLLVDASSDGCSV